VIPSDKPKVAIVGGGLAGLAAAEAAARAGCEGRLFEARRRLGGRADSFRDPKSGLDVDGCQHVALGCCTHFLEFLRRTGLADGFQCHRTLHFFGPLGTQHDLGASAWLPAPFCLVPALLRLSYLTFRDRRGILRAVARLARGPGAGEDWNQRTIASWLWAQGQSAEAIAGFWWPILAGALGDTLDRLALDAARQVFTEAFLGPRRASDLYVPREPLVEIFDRRLGEFLARQGVALATSTPVQQVTGDARRVTGLVLADGSTVPADFAVVAVPWRRAKRLFGPEMSTALPELEGLERIPPSAITAVHLWFDRPIHSLPHAVLVGRTGQWVFHRAEAAASSADRSPGHYYQGVISAAQVLAGRDRRDVLAEICQELEEIWPAARRACLMHWRLVTHPAAVFALAPGVSRLRPAQQTTIPNLLWAGDWTATGWPATMEGAVRSGEGAVERIMMNAG